MLLDRKYSQLKCVIGILMVSLSVPLGKYIQVNYESWKPIVPFLGIGFYLVFALVMYKDPIWKRITAALLTIVVTILADAFIMLIAYVAVPAFFDVATGVSLDSAIMLAIAEAIMVLCYIALIFLWNMLNSRILIKGYIPTLLLPISQVFFAIGANLSLQGQGTKYTVCFFVGEILGFILDIYWVQELYFRSKRAEAEQELRELRYMMQLEQVHYREVESKREDIAKIRHDMRNQILAVQHLIASGKTQNADEMLNQLMSSISKTKEYEYCSLPIVNAILNEKFAECQKKGIQLESNIRIIDNIQIKDVHLCSIFSNLLDNAIRAVDELDDPYRKISIAAITEGGLLVMKIQNYSEKPGELRQGHGLGSVIIREIVGQYNGTYQTTYEDMMFTAITSMEIKNESSNL